MLKHTTLTLFFVTLLLSLNNEVVAQKKKRSSALENSTIMYLGIGLGAVSYKGDLSDKFSRWNTEYAASFNVDSYKRLSLAVGIGIGAVEGQNRKYFFEPNTLPNKYFKAEFMKVWGDLQIKLFKNQFMKLYLSQGFGIQKINVVDADYIALIENYATRPEGETYSSTQGFFPSALCVKAYLPNKYAFSLQYNYVFLGNDYIDNIGMWGTADGSDKLAALVLTFYAPIKTVARAK